MAAHNWTIASSEVKELLNDAEDKKMLDGYPSSLSGDFNETRNSLERLSRVKELHGIGGKRTVEPGMRLIIEALR